MQPQTASSGIHAAGAVLFVKTLKHKGQRLGGNARAGVLDGHLHHVPFFLGGKADDAPRRGEFDGVVHDVVHHLMHKIRVGKDHQAVAAQPLDVDFAVLDALLVRQHHIGDGLPHIVAAGLDGHLARLQLGDVQHVLHQPGQPSCLLRDDGQIPLVFLRRDGAVQHAVNEAFDGGHGGAQLVGDVAHELPPGIVDGL